MEWDLEDEQGWHAPCVYCGVETEWRCEHCGQPVCDVDGTWWDEAGFMECHACMRQRASAFIPVGKDRW